MCNNDHHAAERARPDGEQRSFLFALWEELGIKSNVVVVLHDWGSALGFDWSNKHRDLVQGVAYMEAVVRPLEWSDYPPAAVGFFKAVRSGPGEQLILEENVFVKKMIPEHILRKLSDEEIAEYQRPYVRPGEDRTPVLTWLRQFPIEGDPANVAATIQDYGEWLAKSSVPKLYIHSEPGAIDSGRSREFCRTSPNQTEVTVNGLHYV